MRFCLPAIIFSMLMSACGYHLVGHGDTPGAIPPDVNVVAVMGAGEAQKYVPTLRSKLTAADYTVISSEVKTQAQAVVRLTHNRELFVPSAYDRAGVATQYRMTLSGSVDVEQEGRVIWQSGPIVVQDDVYVTGSLASIEAARQRLKEDLGKEWVRRAWSKLRSGF